jgi:PhnB protein
MTTTLNPYLNFNGQCREAMTFYQQCLGGELTLQRLAESPMSAQLPSARESDILHSTLIHERIILMGSDMIGARLNRGNGISLCLQCHSEAEVNSFFANLSTGGHGHTPLHQTFWGATYGELTDRFGIQWIFNYTKASGD